MGEAKFTILLADDDNDIHFCMRRAIVAIDPGINIISFLNGKEAMDCLRRQLSDQGKLPDIIITDIDMPVMNGFTFLNEIKSNQSFSAIPVFIFSGSMTTIVKDTGSYLGAIECYLKPKSFDFSKVVKSILATV